ncbi:UNVERIFIED_CONTAM: hypothetical protein FKN15_063501 [Acipenser sinensis]
MKRAVLDLNCALKLNPSLACALILRGTLTGLLAEGSWNAFDMKNKDHKKALEMHQDANVFQDMADFKSSQIGESYNRFSLMYGKTPKWHVIQYVNKALEMHQDANVFQDMADFKSSQIGESYNRFLWCLNAPDTVIEVDFLSGSSFNASLPGRPNGAPSASGIAVSYSYNTGPFDCSNIDNIEKNNNGNLTVLAL